MDDIVYESFKWETKSSRFSLYEEIFLSVEWQQYNTWFVKESSLLLFWIYFEFNGKHLIIINHLIELSTDLIAVFKEKKSNSNNFIIFGLFLTKLQRIEFKFLPFSQMGTFNIGHIKEIDATYWQKSPEDTDPGVESAKFPHLIPSEWIQLCQLYSGKIEFLTSLKLNWYQWLCKFHWLKFDIIFIWERRMVSIFRTLIKLSNDFPWVRWKMKWASIFLCIFECSQQKFSSFCKRIRFMPNKIKDEFLYKIIAIQSKWISQSISNLFHSRHNECTHVVALSRPDLIQ